MALDILKEWTELLPDKILDGRDKLPKHKTLKWKLRSLDKIQGICNHQIAGNENPINTAQYHVDNFPRDAKNKGAPGLCYTFYIRKDGTIWWCNDIEAITWSQGYAKRPGSENEEFVSVVCGGNFSGPGYKGKEEPTKEQLNSLVQVWVWLIYHLKLDKNAIFGHFNFGKPACPGYAIMKKMDEFKENNELNEWTDEEWQKALINLGYDLGKFGPDKNGVDGKWGNASKSALLKFQADKKIPTTGYKDELTLFYLIKTSGL